MLTQSAMGLIAPRRVPPRLIVLSAALSAALAALAALNGQPLYTITLAALGPLLPAVAAEALWKVERYGVIAIFAVFVLLQVGHLGEHVAQVAQIKLMGGTMLCPPPPDSPELAARAVAAGLRAPGDAPSGVLTRRVVAPGPDGLPATGPGGQARVGPAACGVFGQLDIEIVHLSWELFGWLTTLWLLRHYPRNLWLWAAVALLSWHALEHLFISHHFFLERAALYQTQLQLWATTVDGGAVTAHPVGKAPALTTFYGAAGKHGILGAGGLVASLFGLKEDLPARPVLHLLYNAAITLPLALAFLVELRRDPGLARGARR
ncbi:MAG TPA: hypothetical protein PKD53_12235 [Chloroflexaceae bacterium]|nr:hypothetical protein [Chloroflexaceae bacterium]